MNKIQAITTIFYLLVFAISGCHTPYQPELSEDSYYTDKEKIKNDIARVAIVELANETEYPEISSQVTRQIYRELQKQQIFSIRVVNKDDPRWERLQLKDKPSYTIEELSRIYESLNQDALLFGKVTEYKPYPHLTVGLRLKLVSLRDARLVWGFEQIWDSENSTTERRIKKYLEKCMSSEGKTLQSELMSVSTKQFIKFAAYETASTLNPE